MATTRTYLDYLDEKIDISPANSQEELDAAELMGSLMEEHGLDVQMQEFDAPSQGKLAHYVLYIVMFVGILLAGFLGTVAGAVGLILVAASFVLLAMEFAGRDVLGNIGPRGRSQNVIGVHRATGPLVMKGNRPIVIVAHYDSPNEDLLSRPQVARYQPMLKRATFYCAVIVPICALVQLMGFLPESFRHIFWIVGILASLPLLAVGVSAIYQKFALCTTGANDNKASLAAMLGVMDMVRPADDAAKRYVALHPRRAMEEFPQEEPAAQGEEFAEQFAGEEQYAGEDGYYPAEPVGEEKIPAEQVQEQTAQDAAADVETVADTEAPAGVEDTDAYYPEAYAADSTADANVDVPAETEAPANPVTAFFKKASASIAGGVRTLRDEVEARRAGGAARNAEQPAEGEGFDETAANYPEDFVTEEPQGEKSESAAPRGDVSGAHDVHVRRATPLPTQVPEVDPFEDNVRRGPDFMGSLNILPADCEIVYDNPPRPRPDLSNLPEIPEIPDFTAEFEEKYAESFSPVASETQGATVPAADAQEALDAEPDAATQPHAAGGLDETRYSPVAAGNPYIENAPAEVDYIHYVTYDEQYPIVEEYEVIEEPKHDEPDDSDEASGFAAGGATDNDGAAQVSGEAASDYAAGSATVPVAEPAQTTEEYDAISAGGDTARMDATPAVDDSQAHLIDLPEIEPHYTAIDHAVPEVIYEDEAEPEPEPALEPKAEPEPATAREPEPAVEPATTAEPEIVQAAEPEEEAATSDFDFAPEQEWDDATDAAEDEDYVVEDSAEDDSANAEQITAEEDEFLIPVDNSDAEAHYYDAPVVESDDVEKDEDAPAEGAADDAVWDKLVAVGTAQPEEKRKTSGFLAKLKSLFAGHGARQKSARFAATSEEPLPVDSTADMPVLHLEDYGNSEPSEDIANVEPTQGYEPVSQESANDRAAQPYAEEGATDYDDDYRVDATDDDDAYDDHDYEVVSTDEEYDAPSEPEADADVAYVPSTTFGVDSFGDDAPVIEDYEVIDDSKADDSQLPDASAPSYQEPVAEEEAANEAVDNTAAFDELEATAHLTPLRPAALRDEYTDSVEPMPTYVEHADDVASEEPALADDTAEQDNLPTEPIEEPAAETAPEATFEPAAEADNEPAAEPADDADEPLEADDVAAAEPEDDDNMTEDDAEESDLQITSDADATGVMSGYSFVPNEEVPEEELAAKDTSGLDAPIEDDTPAEKIPAPRPIDDPSWGRSEFRPAHNSMARRAVLFDLPDPSEGTTDPFGTGSIGNSGALRIGRTPIAAGAEKMDSAPLGTREPIGLVNGAHVMQDEASRLSGSAERTRKAQAAAARKRFSSLFGNREKRRDPEPEQQSMGEWLGVGDDFDAKTDGRKIGDWEHFGEDEKNGGSGRRGDWKGGATTRSGFRVVEGNGDDASNVYGDQPYSGQPYDDQAPYDQQVPYDDQQAYGDGYGDAPQADGASEEAEGYDLYPVDESAYQQAEPGAGADVAADAQGYAVDGYAPGAAPADAYAGTEVAGQEPTQEDLRQAILGMSNDELLAHDIYFVALGASNVDHAGIKHFLAEHRGDIRGAFLVNLDSVGAGDLVFLTHEGRTSTRRSDRRMGRMLMSIAKDLHIPLGRAKLDWGETDATLAMQNSVRATTLMGMSPDGVPALSATSDDVPENVNPSQVVAVSDLIAELIRRS
ncbi:hypothetical protein [Parafannyhessea umbonata]|uniref:hypothetical protein n=1 Tax=Parafannyhessea umbonata TaxID=604330 RepID=UPI002A838C0A|nr:hypothetical protein [Parafannyhessea umbonata]MDY4014075.1 hypothetical protein [Parafannyhessea umbonata]